jgi:hypothetical protein
MRLNFIILVIVGLFTTTAVLKAEAFSEEIVKNISMEGGSFVPTEPKGSMYQAPEDPTSGSGESAKTMAVKSVDKSDRKELVSKNSQSQTCECRCGYFPCKGGGYENCPGGPFVPPTR